MINIEKAKEVFKKYVEKYDATNPRIALKIAHTYRVTEASKKIAEELKLSEEQINLAELIGLLHDIGRFEQLKRYDTFNDRESINHAEFGASLLEENNFLKEFCEDEKYHSVILKAIRNHNKFKIDNDLEGEDLLQSKIIRDADKIDILNLMTFEKFETLFKKDEIINEKISEQVLKDFYNAKQTDRKNVQTDMDNWVLDIGLIFDINFIPSFKILKEKDYINKMIDRTKTEEMENVRKFANSYIEEKINN